MPFAAAALRFAFFALLIMPWGTYQSLSVLAFRASYASFRRREFDFLHFRTDTYLHEDALRAQANQLFGLAKVAAADVSASARSARARPL